MSSIEQLVGKRVEVEGYHPVTGQRSKMDGEVSGVFMVVRTPYGNVKAEITDVVRIMPEKPK
jgi:hypothetical protein